MKKTFYLAMEPVFIIRIAFFLYLNSSELQKAHPGAVLCTGMFIFV